jgi:hypothetical protein
MSSTTDTVMAARRRPAPVPAEPFRPAYLGAGIASLAVFALYALTLAPTTVFWDASEYITVAHILGIPHPPGNPLFVVMSRAWELLLAPTGLSVAVRVNLFSALMGAIAHGCWFLVIHRIASYWTAENRWFPYAAAAAAVLLSATAFTVWNHSNVNEKVYSISLATIALLSWLAIHWRDNLGRGKDDNLILLMVFILALSVGNHLMAFLAAPALAAFILLVEPRTLVNWRLYALGVPMVILGLSVHLFLPIRADLNPIINEADPSCPTVSSAVVSVVTYGRAGCPDLNDALARRQYDKPSIFSDPTDPRFPRTATLMAAQIGNYFQYFDWQWARSLAGSNPLFGGARPIFMLLALLLGIYGGLSNWRRDRQSAAFIGILFLTLSLGLTFYLNFKYGYSYATDTVPNREHHEVRERDYFFIVSFSVWGIWMGLGLAALWARATEFLAARRSDRDRRRPWLFAAPIMLFAFLPLLLNFSWATRHYDYSARDWAYNLLMSVEPYGILFTNGDNDTFPLWYLQEVEGIRRDVTVIVMSYLNTAWYVRQLRDLTQPCPPGQSPADDRTRIICQRAFQSPTDPPIYHVDFGMAETAQPVEGLLGPGQRPPTQSIFGTLPDERIDQIAFTPAHLTQEAMTFRAGSIETTLPRGSLMIPSTWFMTAIINESLADRPIYFATTTQAYNDLRLRPYLIRQGLAFRLSDSLPEEDPARGVYRIPPNQLSGITGDFLELPRTDTLLWNVFMHRGGIPDEWTKWVDRPTQGIPFYYAHVHYAAALVHQQLGNDVEADRHGERFQAWLTLGQR